MRIQKKKNKLFYQFYKAICLAFSPVTYKHSYKKRKYLVMMIGEILLK